MNGSVGAAEDTEITDQVSRVNRNIENEPLVRKIKALEQKLIEAMGDKESVMEDLKEEQDKLDGKKEGKHVEDVGLERKILEELMDDFTELLKTKYGALGYLVQSTSADIEKLYGIDTDREYYCMIDGSRIRIPNAKLDPMVAAGSGRRWIGERGLIIDNPAETPANAKITDNVVNEIIDAIQKKLEK